MLNYPPLQEFIKQHNVKPLYITKSGSQLYGTNTPASDVDYKGLFIPSRNSVLLKEDPDHFTHSTGDDKSKNSSDDLDLTLDSIYEWKKRLRKGETGAVEILFSVFTKDSTVFIDDEFEKFIHRNYKELITRNMFSVIGYAIGQTKRYDIKGKRYQELKILTDFLAPFKANKAPIAELFDAINDLMSTYDFKYIDLQTRKMTRDSDNMGIYLHVLGKSYLYTNKCDYVIPKLISLEEQFGNRAKAATANGVDWKGVSHALRILLSAHELLTTGFISFPVPSADILKEVKAGEIPLEEVMDMINKTLDAVNLLQDTTDLPKQINVQNLDRFLLGNLSKQG